MSLSKTVNPPLSTGSNHEDGKSSRHDWKIVDWDIKHTNKQNKQFRLCIQDRLIGKGGHRIKTIATEVEQFQILLLST